MNTPAHWVLYSALPALLLLASLPHAHAQYKVIGADGKVTYTDRPPINTDLKAHPVNPDSGVTNDVALPFEVRQAAQKYPVVLYVTTDCSPCNMGRELLRTRGIPFAEKSVTTTEDSEALYRLTGSREIPSLTIGEQTLHGVLRSEWMSYLDAAGYPKESRLPANFPVGKATPLTERKQIVKLPEPAPKRPTPQATPVVAPAASGIRF